MNMRLIYMAVSFHFLKPDSRPQPKREVGNCAAVVCGVVRIFSVIERAFEQCILSCGRSLIAFADEIGIEIGDRCFDRKRSERPVPPSADSNIQAAAISRGKIDMIAE